jgi:hypothetical protein
VIDIYKVYGILTGYIIYYLVVAENEVHLKKNMQHAAHMENNTQRITMRTLKTQETVKRVINAADHAEHCNDPESGAQIGRRGYRRIRIEGRDCRQRVCCG